MVKEKKTDIQRQYDPFKAYLEKLEEYKRDLDIIEPKRNSYAKTDYDATFMHMKEDHMRNAQLKLEYNVQIGVSNEYITVIDAYQYGSDFHTFEPLLEKYNGMYNRYPKFPVADAEYESYDNYKYCLVKGRELYQKYGMWAKASDSKFKKPIYNKEHFRVDKKGHYRCPNNKKFVKVREYQSDRIKREHMMEEYACFHCIKCRQKKPCSKAKENRKI